MKTFDWDKFLNRKNHIAVHCKTQEEAIDFCKQMHEHGLQWRSGYSYLKQNNWEFYREETCYSNHGTYGTFGCFEDHPYDNYIILEWSDYMDSDRIETVEEFLKRTKANY